MGSKMLTYEEQREGLDVRLQVTEYAMVAKAMRGGRVLATVSQGHAGALGPGVFAVQASSLAKALMQQAVDKAVGRRRLSAFDQLVERLRAELERRRRPVTFFIKPKPRALFFTRKR